MYVNSINQQPNFGAKARLPRVESFDLVNGAKVKVADELNTVIKANKATVGKLGEKDMIADLFLLSDKKPGVVYTAKVGTRLNEQGERLFRVGDADLTMEQLNKRLSNEKGMVDFYSAEQKAQLAAQTKGLNEAAKRNVGPDSGAQW